MDEIGDNSERYLNFRILYLATQLIGLTLILLICCWVGLHLGGVSWHNNPNIQFNWHPILMTIGMIYMLGNGILLYRGFRYYPKKTLKLGHAILFGFSFIIIVFGLIAVFDSHNLATTPIPNLYSMHSWLGLGTVILFCIQWLAGFISFIFPQLKYPIKEKFMPYHIYIGLTSFILAGVTALIGLSEKAFFHIPNISHLPNEAILVNCIGLLIVIFIILVVYQATLKSYRRLPIPEDTMLLTNTDD